MITSGTTLVAAHGAAMRVVPVFGSGHTTVSAPSLYGETMIQDPAHLLKGHRLPGAGAPLHESTRPGLPSPPR